MLGVGRRTITTKNAYQKMVLPTWGGKSCWNSFVRMYNTHLGYPKYSSLVVGQWDTLTQTGGDNTELFGMYKTSKGVIAVGRSKADASNVALGNALPVTNIPSWVCFRPMGSRLFWFITPQIASLFPMISHWKYSINLRIQLVYKFIQILHRIPFYWMQIFRSVVANLSS